jgi:hypothetical protein
MVVFSIGLPSRFAQWCDMLVRELVAHRLGPTDSIGLNTLQELAAAVIRTPAHNLVVCCRQPVVQLQNEILAAGRPFVVALGDPRAALGNLIQEGRTVADAARAVASSCATMLAIAQAPQALVLTPEDAHEPHALAVAVARHLQLPIADDPAALARALPVLEEDGGLGWWEDLAERDQAITEGALGAYIAHLGGNELDRLVWEPELFFTATESGQRAVEPNGVIDLTGRARCLVYGPYVNLPPGSWSVDIVLGFSAEAAGVNLVAEVFAGSQLAHSRIEVAGEQFLETRLYLTIADTVDEPVQIRIHLERAAFDGRLALGYVAMMPQAAVPAGTRERLVSVLRR